MPDRYLKQHAEMAPMPEVAEILKSMLRCAGVLRHIMSRQGGSDDDLEDVGCWHPFEVAVDKARDAWTNNADELESMPLAGAPCSKIKDCLRMVCEALWGGQFRLMVNSPIPLRASPHGQQNRFDHRPRRRG